MIANHEFSSNQLSTISLSSTGSIAEDNNSLSNDIELNIPTSISLTPFNRDLETEEKIATDDKALELATPTAISLSLIPPNSHNNLETDEEIKTSETEEETETDNSDLELATPLEIESVLINDTSNSVVANQDSQSSITEVKDLQIPMPISVSALPVESATPETVAVIIEGNNTSLSVGEFTASGGSKVTVEIAIANATDLQSLDLEIYYDTELLDIVDPIPETEINEGVTRVGIAADWELLAESGNNPEAELPNPIVNVVEDIGDRQTGKIDINLINPNGTPVSDSGNIIVIDFQVEDVTSESIATIDLRQAELGINGQTLNLDNTDSLLQDGSVIVGVDSIDMEDNGVAEPLNEGIVVIRHLFGAEGEGLIYDAIGNGVTRTSAGAIKSYLNQIETSLDINLNGIAEPLNEGILIIRRLFGAEGEGLINGAIGSGAIRTSPVDIARAIDNLAI